MNQLKEVLSHPWLSVRISIALGVFFAAASLPKLVDPPSFAHMIYNYRILPGPLVNIVALAMPWFELLAGLALIFGIFRQTAASWIGFMLMVFIAALTFNLLRGNAIDCGCFDVTAAGLSFEQRMLDMKFTIARDLGMLLMVAQILFSEFYRGENGEKRPEMV